MATHVIETHDLTKVYRTGFLAKPLKALDGLNLAVREGEIFGYLGPNGSGKTTTIRLILDLIRPTSGYCRVLGRDSHRDSVAIKRDVGNLPSEIQLWPQMTGEQVIRYMARLRPGADIRYALELAERLRLNTRIPMRQYSTGNKRKVGLIQALMHRPALVILDEPTMGLDPLIRQVFTQLMLEIRAEGRTVFLSSHVLSEAQAICDRVGILRRGTLRTVESVSALTGNRWILITTPSTIETAALAAVPGVLEVVPVEEGYRVRVSGSVDDLIRFLGAYQIDDFTPAEINLEDIFVDFYREEI